MGTNVIIITLLFFFKALLLLCLPCKNAKNCVGRFHRKCSGIIFWNFWLRMLIQGCLEIAIAAAVYLDDRDKLMATFDESFDNFFLVNDALSFSLMLVLLVMPLWILVFYCFNFSKLANEKFASVFGSTYDGLRTDRRSVIFFPIYFLLRRFAFVFFALRLQYNASFQIFGLMILNLIAAAYLLVFKPFDLPLLQRLEVFNEFTSMILLYTTLGWLT